MEIFGLLDLKYQEWKNALTKQLNKIVSGWGDSIGPNTVIGQLIEALGSATQNIMLYIEDALAEQNKYTAQRKKSIYSLASISGYEPSLGKAATGNIKISFTPHNHQMQDILISNKTKLTCLANGLIYNIILPNESMIISPKNSNETKYVQIVEGRFEEQRFISDGGQFYSINVGFLGDTDIDYLEVRVNGEKWERVDSLYDMAAYAKQFQIKSSLYRGIDLIFGNEQRGQSLKSGDIVDVIYLLHNGELGNTDVNEEVEFIFTENIRTILGEEIDGNNIFILNSINDDGLNSGTFSESTQQVKEMIGYNSRSFVLADIKNYKTFLNKFSFCGYNRVWSEGNGMLVNALLLKNYNINIKSGSDYFKLSIDDLLLSSNQKKSVENLIVSSGQQLMGVTFNIFDPDICKYAIYIYINLNNNSSKDYIERDIKNLVGEYMANHSDMYIPKSDIINIIKNKLGDMIDGIDVYFMSEKNEEAKINKYYINKQFVWDEKRGIYNIKEEKVRLYGKENPNLGLDEHGSIKLMNQNQFPVLMGGWKYQVVSGQLVNMINPINIIIK